MLVARNNEEMKANKSGEKSMRCDSQRRRKMRAEFLLGDIFRIATETLGHMERTTRVLE